MNIKKMNKGLDFLREKYGAKKGEITLKDGHCYVGATPLLPGRMERKIVELKKMTENGTLEGVSTLRFASFAPGGSRSRATVSDAQERVPPKVAAQLQAMLAKELDLAAYLGASDVVRVMAVASGAAINVLAKLANDVNVSVEVGAGLPRSEAAYRPHLRGSVERARGVRASAGTRLRAGVEGRVGEGHEGRRARVRSRCRQGREDDRREAGPRYEPVDQGVRGEVVDGRTKDRRRMTKDRFSNLCLLSFVLCPKT